MRFFATDTAGSTSVHDIPADVDAGMDVLMADGMSGERAAEMTWAAHCSGRDALAFAEHLVKLRRAARG